MNRLKGFLNPTTVICLLLGACLAVLLAIFVSKDKSITTPITADNTTQTVEENLAEAENDMTDVIGYDLYGEHVISTDGIEDKTITFNENKTVSGYIGKDIGEVQDAHWNITMDDGILHVNFTDTNNAIQYVFSYDDDMNVVLTGEKETLTLTKE